MKRDAPFEGFTIKCYGCQEVHEHQQLDHIKDDPTIRVELRRVHPDAHDLNE